MRYAEKERKILNPNSIHTRPGQENSKKNRKKKSKIKKPISGIIFSQNRIKQAEKEGKNFTPKFCSYPTRVRKFEIKNSKKIQKIKKVNSNIISIQNGLGEGKNEKKKNLFPNSVHTRPVQGNSEKNSKKI